MKILSLLSEPKSHFANQRYHDPAEVGVCVTLLAKKLGLKQPTVSRHLELLSRAGFVRVVRVDRWALFSRNEEALKDYAHWLHEHL